MQLHYCWQRCSLKSTLLHQLQQLQQSAVAMNSHPDQRFLSNAQDDQQLLSKHFRVAFVTADGEADTHFLTQGRLPAPQGHFGAAHLKSEAQSGSPRQVGRSHLEAAHSHFDLHAAISQPPCAFRKGLLDLATNWLAPTVMDDD